MPAIGKTVYDKHTYMKVARVNDLTKEAMVQSIKEGDLRFLTVSISLHHMFSYPKTLVNCQVLINKTLV